MEHFYDLKVKDVMHERLFDVPLATEDTNIKTVLIILTTRGYVWVIDNRDDMTVTGIITEHDVLNLLDNFDNSLDAGKISKKNVITCSPEDDVGDIIEKIRVHNVRRIPVIKNKKLVGEITLRHIIEKFYSILP